MMLQWHLFGSVTKYTTLGQSRGVPDEDRAELESLAFGQSDDPGFRASLQARPAAIGRMLPSGRYGLTRCLPGGPDSSGRSTFMFATFLFEANDWIVTGSQVLPNLLADTALWSRINPKERDPVQADAAWTMKSFSPDMTLAVLDAWATHRDAHRTLIAVEDTPENAAAIMGVLRLLPAGDRLRYAWGTRLLSSAAPVKVASIRVPPAQDLNVVIPRFGQPLAHGYAQAVASFWQNAGTIPEAFILGVPSTDAVETPDAHDSEPAHRASTAGRLSASHVVLLIAAALLVIAVIVGMRWNAPPDEPLQAGSSQPLSAAGDSRASAKATPTPSPTLSDTGGSDERAMKNHAPQAAHVPAATLRDPVADWLQDWNYRADWTLLRLEQVIAAAKTLHIGDGQSPHASADEGSLIAGKDAPAAQTLRADRPRFLLALESAIEAEQWIKAAQSALTMEASCDSLDARGLEARNERKDALMRLLSTAPRDYCHGTVRPLCTQIQQEWELVTADHERLAKALAPRPKPAAPPPPPRPATDSTRPHVPR